MNSKPVWRSWREFNWKSPKTIVPLLVLAVALAGFAAYLDSALKAYAITVNGNIVTVVKTQEEAQRVLQIVLGEKGKPVGQVALTKDQVSFNPVRVRNIDVNSEFTAVSRLKNKLRTYVKGYSITVNGNPVVTLASKAQANQVLQKVKGQYSQPDSQKRIESVSLEENVAVVEGDFQPEQILSVDQAAESLLKGKEQKVSYQVQASDTLWTIARNNDMMIQDLLDHNPGLNPQTVLHIGQIIDIVKTEPYVHVVVTGIETRDEVIPYTTTYQTDTSLGPGIQKTVTAGVDGAKNVSIRFVAKNGVTVAKTTLSEQITKNPVNQVIARGPASGRVYVAASRGSGISGGFAWPLRGAITSGFGPRQRDFHPGIDIDGETGDPFYAARDGVVIFAGWDGGYGNSIVIDHGNGVQTRYGHASRLLVGVGQRVSKGQPIGLVGSTGNSTGSHLHFEIILNGSRVNPLNYL